MEGEEGKGGREGQTEGRDCAVVGDVYLSRGGMGGGGMRGGEG